MTLQIRFDHRQDRLADALLDALDGDAVADGDPFAERAVIVPSAGVGRWLQQRDARRHGVSTRLRFEFAGRWLWRTMRAALPDLPERSPFEPERVRWSLLRLLDELPDAPAFALLRRRVREPGSPARFALADALATRFERYLVYRRDWLARWQRGEWATGARPLGPHEAWQRWLWRRLLDELADRTGIRPDHPYDRFVRLLEADDARVRRALEGLRVALFGRLDLSPEQFALFGRLSSSAEVRIFAPDPCRELWTDMLDARQLAAIRERRPDVAWLYDGEPAPLGDWGRAQRDFVAQILSLEEHFGVQSEAPGRDEPWPFDGPGPAGTLQALQAAVFLRSDAPWREPVEDDGSIEVLGAHGPIRQAEVLHERLLECFEVLPGLEPSQIVVYCADLDAAAAAIEGVFGSAPEPRRIPFAISGRAPHSDPLVAAVQGLLEMTLRGVSAPALEGWLRNPASAEALGLETAEVELLAGWLEAAGARRGLDDEEGAVKHSLRAATDRLLAGAAIGAAAVVGDLAAVPGAQGTRARVLDAWLPVADALARLRATAREPRTLDVWCQVLGDVTEAVFGDVRRHAGALQRVRDALSGLLAGAGGAPAAVLDAAAFGAAFSGALARGAPAAMPAGAVTVCPLGSLPGVPFRVVCLFGLDEGAFPRAGARDELDLMRRAPRFGDRLARVDERGIFLDAVLAARDRLLVLCRSRNPRDDTPLNPSPLVGELLAYLSAQRGEVRARLVFEVPRRPFPARAGRPALIEHPLHPFSARSFAGDGSYAAEWIATVRELARPLATRPPVIGALIDPDAAGAAGGAGTGVGEMPVPPDGAVAHDAGFRDPATVRVEALRDALADPVATWLRDALGLRLARDPPVPEEVEPLWIEADDRALVQAGVTRLLSGEAVARVADALALDPRVAAGAPGRAQAASIAARAAALVDAVLSPSGAGMARREAACAAGPAVLTAQVDGVSLSGAMPAIDAAGAPVFVTAFPLGPHALIDAWLRTALLRVAGGEGPPGRLAAPDCLVELRCPEPRRSLRHAMAWAERIRREPLALFPRSWMRYALALARPARGGAARSPQARALAARARARDALLGGDFGARAAEIDRPAARALFRDAQPEIDPVLAIGEIVYRPIFDDLEVHAPGEDPA